ncbi:unnamed protein product [Rotaria socialis]|uniref:Reverse transcriptase domain-containing protein n=3 Tax=Rotaria socialis TaxID=392032 RepID=A0A820VI72_9BILA|nr:unnamed protein product [Rotaria socialis]
MTLLKCYLSHYTNRLIRQISYTEACVHVKLVRRHHRHLLSKQQIVDVYPQIIVDIPKISLNRIQLDYLSKSDSNPLWSVFDKVIILLNDLRSKKYILSWQLDKMMPKRETVQLAYLYFIPKPHKAGTPLRPIVSSMNMPTTGISKFLDKLIRPIFDKHAQAYTTNGHLLPKTYLCTFDITDLYTMLPQEESLDILIEFLLQYGYQKLQNIPIDIIRKLALIVIKENVFVYEKKFYRQVIGGAMGSAFTLTLANIFMWKWEKQLVHRLKVSNEIYGRYIDDIFFTSNDSLESTDQILDEANNFHPNIKLVRQIGRSVPFLDVFIQNSKGVLKTSMYHKEAAEPYVVPFGSDHPDHVFRNTVDTAITKAVRYSTTLSQFEEEIRQMKLMFLYNGYPPRHIDRQLTTLFSKYLSIYFILPMLNNSDDFDYLRHQLLTTSTDKIYNRTVKSSTTDQTSDKNMQNQLVQPTDNNEITKSKSLIIHKRHEQRLTQNQYHIQGLWMRTFHGTDVTNTALIFGTCLNRNLKQELMPKMIKSKRRAAISQEITTQHETGKQT